MRKKNLVVAALIVFAGALASGQGPSLLLGQGPASFPSIVVLEDNFNFGYFARSYRADERAANDPDSWGYLNRGVAGAVQYMERRDGFRADHVYSHAVRGFAARLTAQQIQQLENDPMVRYVEPDGTMNAIAQTLP